MIWVECTKENDKWKILYDSDSATYRGISQIVVSRMNELSAPEIKRVSFDEFSKIVKYLPVVHKQSVQKIINFIKTKTS